MARRTVPVQREGQCSPAGLRTQLFLTHIVRPAAAALADTTTHDQHVHDGPVVHVHVIPVIHGGADDHHRLTVRIVRILCELAGNLRHLITRHAGNLFLPGRGVGEGCPIYKWC